MQQSIIIAARRSGASHTLPIGPTYTARSSRKVHYETIYSDQIPTKSSILKISATSDRGISTGAFPSAQLGPSGTYIAALTTKLTARRVEALNHSANRASRAKFSVSRKLSGTRDERTSSVGTIQWVL